jgi:hypothetical protein
MNLEQKLDAFQHEVIDRLARIETNQERDSKKLDRMNGQVGENKDSIVKFKGIALGLGVFGGGLVGFIFWAIRWMLQHH